MRISHTSATWQPRPLPPKPGSRFQIFSHKILQKVQEGAVDLGIVTLPMTANNMEVIPVFRDEVQVVVPKSHALAKNKSVTVEELV